MLCIYFQIEQAISWCGRFCRKLHYDAGNVPACWTHIQTQQHKEYVTLCRATLMESLFASHLFLPFSLLGCSLSFLLVEYNSFLIDL